MFFPWNPGRTEFPVKSSWNHPGQTWTEQRSWIDSKSCMRRIAA
jgi:hypothetical protein